MIVVDASVVANALGDDGPDGELARTELRHGRGLSAPDLVDVETVAVLRKRWLSGALTDARFAAAVDDLVDLDIDRYPVLRLMSRAFELRSNVTPHAAAYIALAQGLGAILVTADDRLARCAGSSCAVKVLTEK